MMELYQLVEECRQLEMSSRLTEEHFQDHNIYTFYYESLEAPDLDNVYSVEIHNYGVYQITLFETRSWTRARNLLRLFIKEYKIKQILNKL